MPAFVLASDTPDLEVNPSTGLIESVSVSPRDGDRVRHVEDSGQGGAVEVTIVSSEPASGSRIAIKPNGESWAVWQSDGGEIRCTFRDPVSKVWSPETTLSDPGELSHDPSIAHMGSATWIAFEIDDDGSTAIGVMGIPDSPEPWPHRQIVASTSWSGANVAVRAESGRVWVTWLQSAHDVGWAVYDPASDTWSGPQFEPYGASSSGAAREAIRARVFAH